MEEQRGVPRSTENILEFDGIEDTRPSHFQKPTVRDIYENYEV